MLVWLLSKPNLNGVARIHSLRCFCRASSAMPYCDKSALLIPKGPPLYPRSFAVTKPQAYLPRFQPSPPSFPLGRPRFRGSGPVSLVEAILNAFVIPVGRQHQHGHRKGPPSRPKTILLTAPCYLPPVALRLRNQDIGPYRAICVGDHHSGTNDLLLTSSTETV
ncbi:hypothetical protein IAQ61_008727 [Plenodomus lingam]|uniref:uncharacterized protein n=1 Tax=Leptosphaeria maculans TaxID=5022 RepID=UPI00332033DA|nr:hypothetical protein IAQ61_008727 [Plenodomus lingam]